MEPLSENQDKMNIALELIVAIDILYKSPGRINAIVAGGAVRDYLHNKPINDLDIYTSINFTNSVNMNALIAHSNGILRGCRIIETLSKNIYTNNKFVALELKNGTRVELITTERKSPEDIITGFDIGLCQCAYNSEGKLITTDKFRMDFENRWLTVHTENLSPFQLHRCFNYHLPKVKKKYPPPDYYARLGTDLKFSGDF